MAAITTGAVVEVVTKASMLSVHCGLRVHVAVQATEHRVVIGIRMAFRTSVPLPPVCARVDREAVVERRAGPGACGVAVLAGPREAGRQVIGIRDCVVSRSVAGVAVRRRAGETAIHVAVRARDGSVFAGEREPRPVMIPRCRLPRRRAVAGFTGCWETRAGMVGACCLLELSQMAAGAGRGRASESAADVTGGAGRRGVLAR